MKCEEDHENDNVCARDNMHGEITKLTNKKNMHATCPLCNETEIWEHVILYEK